jgi:hypothetical protein
LPVPKRPPTAGGVSDTNTHNDIVMAEESLMDFSKKDPEIMVPPNADKRTFNENDILGDLDRDEKGNIIVL